MRNIWTLELKKLHSKSMYAFLAIFIVFTVLDNIIYIRLNVGKPDLLVGNFGLSLFLTQLYFIYLASISITSDFHLGTSKSIYTGTSSRIKILQMKAEFLLCLCVTLALLNVVIGGSIELMSTSRLDVTQLFSDFIQLIFVYGLYMGSLYAFSVLLSALFLNKFYLIICNYIAFIFIGELAAQAMDRGSVEMKNVMESMPFYVVTNGFNQLQYSFSSVIVLIIFCSVSYSVGIIIFHKRDLI